MLLISLFFFKKLVVTMSWIAFFGGLESGLIYAIVALGVYISFRVLDFPDLTADGSFPLGGAVAGVAILAGVNPWLACVFGMLAGAIAGMITAYLHVKLGILQLLSSILMMVALYSINLRIMKAPNLPLLGSPTIFDSVTSNNATWIHTAVILGVVLVVMAILNWFFHTETGLAMRATGSNLKMSQAQGINTTWMTISGMAISNGLIALAGAIFVQTQGGVSIDIGVGTIVIGLAGVIIGETILPSNKIWLILVSAIIGAVLYRLFIQIALSNEWLRGIGFGSQDLNLITALLVIIVLMLPKMKAKIFKKRSSLS